MLNVALGSSVYQDVGTDPGHRDHARPRRRRATSPPTRSWSRPGSRFAETLGTDEIEVNGISHWAVKALGAGLRAVAWAQTRSWRAWGWSDRSRFVLGVQWPPEELVAHSEPARRLFAALVAAARKS